nr:hypothetical protein [Tanacetum cinerariifolium]
MLPKSNQTIFDAPDGYIDLYTHCFSLANIRLPLSRSKVGKVDSSLFKIPSSLLIALSFFPKIIAGLKPSWEYGQQRHVIIVDGKEMAFRDLLYVETDEDLSFHPKEPSPNFSISSPSVSINTDPHVIVSEPTGQLMKGECEVLKEREKARDNECEELKAKCEAVMADFNNNPAVKVLHEKIADVFVEVKEHKDSLGRILLKSKTWAGYQVILSTLESKVTSLEAEKAKLEATEASLHQEVENVKLDRVEVISKVVTYVAIELVQSDDMGKLIVKRVSFAIFFGRCQAFQKVTRMKDLFDLRKIKDPYAFVKALLSKKP